MLCKVYYYNDATHVIVVDYNGIRIQFVTFDYKGGAMVNVQHGEKGYFIVNEVAKKVTRTPTKKVKKEQLDTKELAD